MAAFSGSPATWPSPSSTMSQLPSLRWATSLVKKGVRQSSERRNRSKVDGRAEEDAKNSRINETRVELVVGRAASGFADERSPRTGSFLNVLAERAVVAQRV